MKKNMMLTLMVLPIMGSAKALPLEITLGAQTSYETIKFSEAQIKNAGFYDVYEGNDKLHAMLTTIGVEAKYVKNIKGWDLKAGAGLDLILENNLSSPEFKAEEVIISKSAKEAKVKLENAKKEYKNIEEDILEIDRKDREYVNKIEAKNFLSEKIAVEVKELMSKIELIEKAIEYKESGNVDKIDEEIAIEKKNKEEANQSVAKLNEEISVLDLTKDEDLKKHFELTKKKDEANIKWLIALSNEEDLKNIKKYIDYTEEDIEKINKEIEVKSEDYYKLVDEKEALEEMTYELSDEKYDLEERMEVLKDKIEALRKEFEAEYEHSIPNNNYQASLRYNQLFNKQFNFGSSLYGIFEFEKEIKKDFSLLSNIKGGLTVLNNPLYNIAKTFENEKIKVNGVNYAKPTSLSPVRLKPFVHASVGLKYKDFRTEVFAGYNKGYVGLKLAYDFK